MQEGYFKTCWNDIKSTPNWFGKLLLLSLLMLIPIFGPIVVTGYLYGWARDIAWNVKGPMPAHIFGNEDGKLYSRGFFILVQGIVLSLVVSICQSLWTGITGISAAGMYDAGASSTQSFALSGFVGAILIIVLYIAVIVFSWIGAMRIAIYDRLGPGFQFGKMWSMARHDSNGLLRIFGMQIVLAVIVVIVASVLWTLLGAISVSGLMVMYPTTDGMYSYSGRSDLGLALLIILLMLAVVVIVTMPLAVFTEAMTARALGYWTRQFDVPNWRGQDEPMPHEANPHTNVQNAAPVAPVVPTEPAAPETTAMPVAPETPATPAAPEMSAAPEAQEAQEDQAAPEVQEAQDAPESPIQEEKPTE